MGPNTSHSRTQRTQNYLANLKTATADLFSQEFALSTGHATAFLSGCLFAPSLLTFWFVNGLLDFSSALALGTVVSPAGLQLRLVAYLLLVPTFLVLRATIHLTHPAHREQVLSGSCPRNEFLSLDWFSVGILATGLPLSFQEFGPWIGMNAVLLVGLLIVPRIVSPRAANVGKLVAILIGPLLFLYAKYGELFTWMPAPATTLGPIATSSLSDSTTRLFLQATNSLLSGPILVALFAVVMNYVLTHPEVKDIPLVRYSLPKRDPSRVVATSAILGTVFYLLVVAAATGSLRLLP